MSKEKNLAFLVRAYKVYDWSHILSWYSVMLYLSTVINGHILRLLALWGSSIVFLVLGGMPWDTFRKEYAVHRCLKYGETFKENERPLYDVEYRHYREQKDKHWYQKLLHPVPFGLPLF